MSLEPGVALQPIDIAIKACQELQGEPQIDNGPRVGLSDVPLFCGAWAPHDAVLGCPRGGRGAASGV